MRDPFRRQLLVGAAGVLTLTAGCIADETDSPSKSNATGDGDDTNRTDGGERNESSNTDERNLTETCGFQYPEPVSEPDAALFLEREDANEWLTARNVDDDSVTAFVEETAFEESFLVALEASAPDLCHELRLESATLEADVLELEAAVRDTSTDKMVCAQQVTTVVKLVRYIGSKPVTEVSATIIDRNGAYRFDIATKSSSEASTSSAGRSNSSTGHNEQSNESDSE